MAESTTLARPPVPGRHRASAAPRRRGRRVTSWAQRLARLELLPLHLLIVAVCVPDTATSGQVALAHVTAADLAACLVIAVAGLRLLRGDGPAVLRSRALLPTAAVLIAVSLSAVFATDQQLAAAGWVRWVEVDVLLPVAAFVLCRTVRAIAGVLTTFVVVAAFEGVYGVVQYVTGTGAGYGEEAIRAIGTFGAGNQLAMGNLVADAGLLCLAGALALPARRHRILAGIAAVGFVVPLLLSLSRGALLSAVVAAVLVLGRVGWRTLVGTALAGAVAATVVLVAVPSQGAVVVERVDSLVNTASSPDQSVEDRYGLWHAALRMWAQDPVTGIGVKNFSEHRDTELAIGTSSGADAATGTTYERVQLLSPHEQYLLVLSEQGVIGILAYLALVLVAAVGPLRRDSGRRGTQTVVALSLFGIGVQFAVSCFWGDLSGPTAPLQGIIFGLALRMASTPRRTAPTGSARRIVLPDTDEATRGRTLRVLHVCQPVDAGVAKFVARTAELQRDAGIDVVVACPPQGWLPQRLDELGIARRDWRSVRSPVRGVLSESTALRTLVRGTDPDVVHLHSAKAGLVGRLVVHGSRPTVFQPHAWAFEATSGPMAVAVRAWEAFALHLTDCLLLVSRAELDRAADVRLPLDVTARRLVRNGLDLREHGADDTAAARRELGVPAGPLVVCVGRLAEQKGQDRLLRAWPLVQAAVPEARLALVGDGPDEDALRLEAADLRGVEFVGPTNSPRTWYAAADVVVVPSRYEGFAFVPLEAMAARRSLVVHDHPALREAVPAGAGAVVDADDPTVLATALVHRLRSPEVRDQEGAAGRAHVVTARDDRTLLPQVLDVYSAAGATW